MEQHRTGIEQAEIWLEPVSWNDRRDLRRIDAALPAILDHPDRPGGAVTVADISTHGCRVDAGALRSGDRVRLHLPDLDPIRATVAWAGPREAGLEFRLPLDPATVARFAGG